MEPLLCVCGREFHQTGAFASHRRSCQNTKRKIDCALQSISQEKWKKRRTVSHSHNISSSRRTRRKNCQLPHRYRHPLPQPLPPAALPPDALPPDALPPDALLPNALLLLESERPDAESQLSSVGEPLPAVNYTTGKNVFGLFRTYHSANPPTHDPESLILLQDLSEDHERTTEDMRLQKGIHTQAQLYPYPNESAFRLGEWYWDGTQKSQSSFMKLLDIISNPSFRPADVRDVPWCQINSQLASSTTRDAADVTPESAEWLEEDAGW
ncbi:hypothetical protein FIBSPDRAFT_770925, partial [Athelia psychrophila]